MPHDCLAWRLLALIVIALAPGLARAESSGSGASAGVAIVDFAYVDTSGEPVDQTAVHRERLQAFMATLRRDVAAEGRFHLASLACEPPACTDGGPAADDLLRAARDGGARILIMGGIHKRSTLIQTA